MIGAIFRQDLETAEPWVCNETGRRAIWPIAVGTDGDGVRCGEGSASALPLPVSTPGKREPCPKHPARRVTDFPSLPNLARQGKARHSAVSCTVLYCTAAIDTTAPPSPCHNRAKKDNHTSPIFQPQPTPSREWHMALPSVVIGSTLPTQSIVPMWSPTRTCT